MAIVPSASGAKEEEEIRDNDGEEDVEKEAERNHCGSFGVLLVVEVGEALVRPRKKYKGSTVSTVCSVCTENRTTGSSYVTGRCAFREVPFRLVLYRDIESGRSGVGQCGRAKGSGSK